MKKYLCYLMSIQLTALLILNGWTCEIKAQSKAKLLIGAYYFDGWAGKNRKADPNEAWAMNAPSHVTRRLVEEFSDREPVWGKNRIKFGLLEKYS